MLSAKQIAYTAIFDLLAKAPASRKPNNLPVLDPRLPLFQRPRAFLERLSHRAYPHGAGTAAAVTGKALHGLGGVGKTRVAMRHADRLSALLFLRAESPERLDAGLAALAGAGILDLPEKEARKDAMKISAALGWLENHPVWLMILDNVDDRTAAAAVEKLMPKLFGGRVLITGRMANFSPAVEMLPLDVLDIADATAFYLSAPRAAAPGRRTRILARSLAGKRAVLGPGSNRRARTSQRGASRIARYLKLWQENRARCYTGSIKNSWPMTTTSVSPPPGRRRWSN